MNSRHLLRSIHVYVGDSHIRSRFCDSGSNIQTIPLIKVLRKTCTGNNGQLQALVVGDISLNVRLLSTVTFRRDGDELVQSTDEEKGS